MLANLLRSRKAVILDRYEETVASVATLPTIPHDELVDHLPLFLDHLADGLESEHAQARETPLVAAAETAREHGEQRFAVGFGADALVRDYQILHASILDVAEMEGVHLSYNAHRALVPTSRPWSE